MSGMIRRLRWKIVGISMLFVTLVLAAVFTGVMLTARSSLEQSSTRQLEEALRDRSFGAARMADTLCQQMLIDVNRDVLRSRTAQEERDSYRVDPKMEEVLRYILDHLGEELTVESLSKRFFISRYYLMHRFKAVTGYTVHQYISQKRLLRAGDEGGGAGRI